MYGDVTRVRVRPAAVAGAFYPRDPDRLRVNAQELLSSAAAPAAKRPKALIAPHAGYGYSGQTAAAAFAMLRNAGSMIERVVIMGPAHYLPVRGIAVPNANVFQTPLGNVPVDADAIEQLSDLPFIVRDDEPHVPEHALELELPFLQVLLGSFRLIPLLVGEVDPEAAAATLRRLWGGAETLIVISSDLSHYHDYETARQLDSATATLIENGEWRRLGPTHACGFLAIAGLLIEAGKRGAKSRLLSLCNSGDTAGPTDRVVGYGAWKFEEPSRLTCISVARVESRIQVSEAPVAWAIRVLRVDYSSCGVSGSV